MFDDRPQVNFSPEELTLIESALQTQEKILSLQSRAGASAAREKLTDLKALLRRIEATAPTARRSDPGAGWGRIARSLFC